jgi:hypothetical protein
MRAVSVVLLLVGLAAVVAVTSGQMGQKSDSTTVIPDTNGKALWKYITETNPYLGWAIWPGYDHMVKGQSPHGAWVKYYVNGIAMKAAREGKDVMPYGAILVKENYAQDKKTLESLTPMYRVKGYNPEGGDWFWAKFGPDGKVIDEGKVKSCIECHKVAGDFRFIQFNAKAAQN